MADSYPPVPPPVPSAQSPTSGLAITSLVLGILSVTAAGCVTGLPAVICGHMARGEISRSNNSIQGAGIALAGLILGYLSMVITVVVLVLVFVIGFAAVKAEDEASNMSREVKAQATMGGIKSSLALYKTSAGAYPTTAQGLKALVERPVVEPVPKDWEKTLDEVTADPWGNAFFYESPGRKNPDNYDIFSSGPDGEPETGDDVWPSKAS